MATPVPDQPINLVAPLAVGDPGHDAAVLSAIIAALKKLDETGQLTGTPYAVFGGP